MVFKLLEEFGSCQLFEKIKRSTAVMLCSCGVKNSRPLAELVMIEMLSVMHSRALFLVVKRRTPVSESLTVSPWRRREEPGEGENVHSIVIQ